MNESKSNLPAGLKGFFAWLQVNQPKVHDAALERLVASENLSGLGLTDPNAQAVVAATTSTAPASPSLADKIKDIVFGVSQAYLTAQQLNAQKKVLDMQLARAKQGLPPLEIDMQQYGLTGPAVQVGMSPETRNLLIYGAVGLAAVYLLGRRRA